MRALVWEGPGRMAVHELPAPSAGPGEAVVRVYAAGICGSEVEGYLGRQGNRVPPLVMGHEFSGEVTAIGEGTDPTWLGARVTVNPLLTCGVCEACRAGRRNVCARRALIGIARPGGFAAETAVPASALVRLPAGLDARLAALAEPLANGVHAVGLGMRGGIRDATRGGIREVAGDAIVIGAGTIGLAVLQAAVAAGLERVAVVEPHPGRRAQAAHLGAHATFASVAELADATAPLVIDAVGRGETRATGLALTRAGGTLVAIGLHDDRTEIGFHDLIRRELAIQASYAYSDTDFAEALALLAAGRAGVGPLEPVLPLEAGPAAFTELARGASDRIKIFLSGNV